MPTQLDLPFENPFDPGNLVGRESKGVIIISQPRFDWTTGKWTALADCNNMLVLAEFNIYKK